MSDRGSEKSKVGGRHSRSITANLPSTPANGVHHSFLLPLPEATTEILSYLNKMNPVGRNHVLTNEWQTCDGEAVLPQIYLLNYSYTIIQLIKHSSLLKPLSSIRDATYQTVWSEDRDLSIIAKTDDFVD